MGSIEDEIESLYSELFGSGRPAKGEVAAEHSRLSVLRIAP